MLDRRLVHERLLGLLVVEAGNRNSPGALPRDAPVVAAAHHRSHSLGARRGDKLNLIELGESLVPKSLHGRKPLLGGAEDGGFLRAPVVRVLVVVGLLEDERVGVPKFLDALLVAVLQDRLTDEIVASLVGEEALVVHGREQG